MLIKYLLMEKLKIEIKLKKKDAQKNRNISPKNDRIKKVRFEKMDCCETAQ